MDASTLISLWQAHCEQHGPDAELFERRYPFSWGDRDAEWAWVCETLDAHEPEEDEEADEWEEFGEPVGAMER